MAQVTAGEVVTFQIGDYIVKAKVEDASKSDFILAKVESSSSPDHKEEQVYEFDRSLLQQK
jgi:hypothetical protein